MNFNSAYGLGEVVFLKTDPDQFERMITQVSFKADGGCVYALSMGSNESSHYEVEMSSKRDLMKQLDISDKNQAI